MTGASNVGMTAADVVKVAPARASGTAKKNSGTASNKELGLKWPENIQSSVKKSRY
jgi:hypothetical protein